MSVATSVSGGLSVTCLFLGVQEQRKDEHPFFIRLDLELPVGNGGGELQELVKGQAAVLVVVELSDRDFGRELTATQFLEQNSELIQGDGAALVGVDLVELGLDVSDLFLGEVGHCSRCLCVCWIEMDGVRLPGLISARRIRALKPLKSYSYHCARLFSP